MEHLIATGHFADGGEVIDRALRLLEQRERRLQWLRAELALAEEQAARGELIDFTPELLEEIKQRARDNARSGKPIRDTVKP